MALTKISTGGVKDDAASQAKIADEAVDEARLQVSNAGTNGQFLQKQSGDTGGLTWATATTDTSDKASLSGANFTGKVKVSGPTDYQGKFGRYANEGIFLHSEAQSTHYNWRIATQTTVDGGFEIAPSTAVGGETFDTAKFVIKQNGAISVGSNNAFGSSGQVLTSGGASAAPSWAAVPPGGNTFTAVANGSIANNKAVKIDTDGKVSEIGVTTTAVTGNPPGTRAGSTESSATDIVRNSWNANQNKMVILFKFTSGAGGYLGARVATIGTAVDSSSFSVGNFSTISTTPGNDVAVGYDPNTYQHLFVYNDDSKTNDKLCARLGTISGTSISYGTQVDLYTADTSGFTPSVMYDDSNDKFIVVYRNSSFKLTAVVGTVSGTDISFSSPVSSTDSHIMYDGSAGVAAAFDTDQNKVLAVFRNPNNSNNMDYCVGSISSGSISWGTIAQLTSTECDYIQLAFGETNNKFMIAFRGTNDSNYGRVMSAKIDSAATTVTAGSEFYLRSAATTSGQNIQGKSIAWDSSSNIFGIYAVNTSHSNTRSFITYATDASGTGAGQPITQQGATAYESLTYGSSHQNVAIESMGSHGAFVHTGMRTSDYYPRYGVRNAVAEASNLTDGHHYVGFADQAYTNGQTATIKTTGNNVSTLSGLTAGTKYYVQNDGTVGTSAQSPSCLAGLALSSSKLLIREGKSDV